MRIWHSKLVPVLPRPQLVAAWRELSSIAGAIQKNGTPNHILVNFVLNYDYDDFINYAKYVREEMTRRGYRTMNSVWEKIVGLKLTWQEKPIEEVYKEKMNSEYLTICYWNLREKFRCGGISANEFMKIEEVYKENMNV